MAEQQLSLWDRRQKSIDERFAKFDARNPQVWQAFVKHTLRLIARGRVRYSADAILHVIRYDHDVSTSGDDWKINNNFSSRYARKFARHHPEHAEFFEQRCLVEQRKQSA